MCCRYNVGSSQCDTTSSPAAGSSSECQRQDVQGPRSLSYGRMVRSGDVHAAANAPSRPSMGPSASSRACHPVEPSSLWLHNCTSGWRRWLVSLATLGLSIAIAAMAGTVARAHRPLPLGSVTLVSPACAAHRSASSGHCSRAAFDGWAHPRVDGSQQRRVLVLEPSEAYLVPASKPRAFLLVRVSNNSASWTDAATYEDCSRARAGISPNDRAAQLWPSSADAPHGTDVTKNVAATTGEVGYRVAAETEGLTVRPHATRVADREERQERHLAYVQEPLRYVVDDINRYTTRKLLISDVSVGQMQYTGTVFVDRLNSWLEALQATFQIEVFDDGTRRVLRRPKPMNRVQPAIPLTPGGQDPHALPPRRLRDDAVIRLI